MYDQNHIMQMYNKTRATYKNEKQSFAKFMKRDFVQLVKRKSQFEHGYTEKWTTEIF